VTTKILNFFRLHNFIALSVVSVTLFGDALDATTYRKRYQYADDMYPPRGRVAEEVGK